MEEMNEAIQFMHEYTDFSDPNCVWVMKGISRNKDNPPGHVMHRFLRRMILVTPEDIDSCYEEIHLLANDPKTVYRIYISLNSRDVVDAAFQFQKKLVDITQGLAKGHLDALQMSKKVGSIWKTELEQRHARGTKRFLLDVDKKPDLDLQDHEWDDSKLFGWMKDNLKGKIITSRRTVSGWAFVFEACDTRALMEFGKGLNVDLDLQRDSMLFVEQF
jgi:hypothetical protein